MSFSKRLFAVATLLTAATLLVATGAIARQAKHGDTPKGAPTKAVCVLIPTKDSKVTGIVTFTQKGDAIEITGEITGLTPGNHGFHVHEFGDISSADGMATGGHFNPGGDKHGGPEDKERHVGDLGNITADDTGKATLKTTDKMIRLHGMNSIIGRGLIVHAKADDLKSQPTGDAGGRVAQGVIGAAK
ncbi:MAG: superoxide dismutase family protein [Planctomycetes bacterium]|nr:superoxide dismutase family protein [Planctomycetota bacterium]